MSDCLHPDFERSPDGLRCAECGMPASAPTVADAREGARRDRVAERIAAMRRDLAERRPARTGQEHRSGAAGERARAPEPPDSHSGPQELSL